MDNSAENSSREAIIAPVHSIPIAAEEKAKDFPSRNSAADKAIKVGD